MTKSFSNFPPSTLGNFTKDRAYLPKTYTKNILKNIPIEKTSMVDNSYIQLGMEKLSKTGILS